MQTAEPSQRIREVLFKNDVMEFVRIIWGADSQSDKHDHGSSHGFTVVGGGELYEIRDGLRRDFVEGDTFTEQPGTIHVVGSVNGGVSYHLYFPPITGTMKTYPKDPKEISAHLH